MALQPLTDINIIIIISVRLKQLNSELEKIPRTDDKYLKLLTEEHAIIKDEQALIAEVL